MQGAELPDTWIDVESTIETKIAALREHKSQIADMDGMAQRVRERSAAVAEGHEMRYAEAFKRFELA